ncbi:MAG: hypothetical protein ACO1RX_03860 [Candidatus Sericytochromatia bacterium]
MKIRSLLLTGLGLGMWVLGMRLAAQGWLTYFDAELLLVLGLATLAFACLQGREGLALLSQMLLGRPLGSAAQTRVLLLLRQFWRMMQTFGLLLILLKAMNALVTAGTPQEMAALGNALATLLLGGLYLLLLRGLILLPAEAALRRQHLLDRVHTANRV